MQISGPSGPCRSSWEYDFSKGLYPRELPAESSSQLTAGKKIGTSVLQLQGNQFCQQAVSLKEDPKSQMRITVPAKNLISTWERCPQRNSLQMPVRETGRGVRVQLERAFPSKKRAVDVLLGDEGISEEPTKALRKRNNQQ